MSFGNLWVEGTSRASSACVSQRYENLHVNSSAWRNRDCGAKFRMMCLTRSNKSWQNLQSSHCMTHKPTPRFVLMLQHMGWEQCFSSSTQACTGNQSQCIPFNQWHRSEVLPNQKRRPWQLLALVRSLPTMFWARQSTWKLITNP